jgi:tetratricopeptide (TPR) repeat protein
VHRRIALSAALTLACASAPPAPNGIVSVTQTRYENVARGPGAELCDPLPSVDEQIQRKEFADAEARVDQMLERFDQWLAGKPGRPVSVANDAQLGQVRAATNGETLIPLDLCYGELFQRKAFLQVERRDLDAALETLQRKGLAAPTMANTFTERGFILNQLHRYAEARRAYEHALYLIARYPANPDEAVAQRGLGYALTELGELDAAQRAYERSLELDPGNALAENELGYIQHLRQQR